MNGIVALSLVPLRTNHSEQSEMCSQLLYGECVEILETHERWFRVRNFADNYIGWVDKKMIYLLTENKEIELAKAKFKPIQVLLGKGIVFDETENHKTFFIPGGSLVPFINEKPYSVEAKEMLDMFVFSHEFDNYEVSGERIAHLAKEFLNAPYLWGGKTVLGIDCSGLVQVVYAMCNIQLPRDANQQVERGQTIDFLAETRTGDLAFFENDEGKIIHVGILLASNKIIHASGWVNIDSIDAQGIIPSQTGEYSHKLRILKRIIL